VRIVLVIRNVVYFYLVETTVRSLVERGNEVTIIINEIPLKPSLTGRSFQTFKSDVNGRCCIEEPLKLARDGGFYALAKSRALLDYGTYFKPKHTSSHMSYRHDPGRLFNNPIGRTLLASEPVRNFLRRKESLFPAESSIMQWLKERRPDVVVGLPYFWRPGVELEYVKAAKTLGISTVVPVIGWDNLTFKGTFHVIPDLTIVWDKVHVEEATGIHDLPLGKLLITGAPQFDWYYQIQPTTDKESFLRKIGLDPLRPFVLYLASSRNITAGDEPVFVEKLFDTLRNNSSTHDLQVLIRPYPMSADLWRNFKMDNVVVWPTTSHDLVPDIPDTRQYYFESLFHSSAVVGVNTSGIFQAAILDKPCVTVLTEDFRRMQEEVGHFTHELNAGFLDVAFSFEETAKILSDIVSGKDARAKNRKRFVSNFLKPRGLTRPVGELNAVAIELAAQGRTASEIDKVFGYTE
jgi:hypothetical protein